MIAPSVATLSIAMWAARSGFGGTGDDDVYSLWMDNWRCKRLLNRWKRHCKLKRKHIFDKYKADELLRYKKILIPFRINQLMIDCMRRWRISTATSKRRRKCYFLHWKRKAGARKVQYTFYFNFKIVAYVGLPVYDVRYIESS